MYNNIKRIAELDWTAANNAIISHDPETLEMSTNHYVSLHNLDRQTHTNLIILKKINKDWTTPIV